MIVKMELNKTLEIKSQSARLKSFLRKKYERMRTANTVSDDDKFNHQKHFGMSVNELMNLFYVNEVIKRARRMMKNNS